MKYLRLYEDTSWKPSVSLPFRYSDEAIIRDEFLINVFNYLGKDDYIYLNTLTKEMNVDYFAYILKGKVAKVDRIYPSSNFCTLTYHIKGRTIKFDFPAYQLVNTENYQYLSSTQKYNL